MRKGDQSMPVPKSVTKMKMNKAKDGFDLTFIDNVDAVNYTIRELIRRANIDVGTFIAKSANARARNELPVYKRGTRVGTLIKKAAFQYWARKDENDLIVGIKHNTWYGVGQELGDNKMSKHGILYNTVKENIDQIREIQGQYLSAINDDNQAKRLAEQAEQMSGLPEE